MRVTFFLLALLAAGMSGCEQQQTKILSLREEFQRQLQTKEKTIEDLNRRVLELGELNSQLQQQLLKSSQESASPERLAESVARKVDEQNAKLKTQMDEILQAVRSGSAGQAPRDQNPSSSAPPAFGQPPVREPSPSDPNRRKYKFEF